MLVRKNNPSKIAKEKRRKLFLIGGALVVAALAVNLSAVSEAQAANTQAAFTKAFDELSCGVCAIFAFLEGSYGALVTTIAGVGAIIAAGFSNIKLAYNIMIVAIGCFIIRAMISLFFYDYQCPESIFPQVHGQPAQSDGAGCAKSI